MSASTFKNPDTKRRLERILARERLRLVLKIVGVAFVGVGVGAAIIPFGPPVSNPVVVPNVDPNAGLSLLQKLPSNYQLYVGLALMLVGAFLLLYSALLSDPTSDGSNE